MKIFVPGRICLFGEHSDWAGGYRRINASVEKGYAIIAGTNQGIYADVKSHPHSLVVSATSSDGTCHGPVEIPMEAGALLEVAEQGGFFSYMAGVAYQVLVNYQVKGLVIHNYQTDLPVKKGLSSSAAISVLTARAFNRVYDLKLTTRGEMELAYQGEITTPSRCGRMDQGCAFGNRPVLMTFDGERITVKELRVKEPLHFVIVDLKAKKDTKEILQQLNRSYPFADNELEMGVHSLLGPINKRVVHEAVEELEGGGAEQLGGLMKEAQAQFDQFAVPACPHELTAPVLHKVLAHPGVQPYVWGGKGVGSQGDGTAQFLARDEESQAKAIEVLERDLGVSCLKLTLTGGPRIRKALIPAAGFGTRLFPASRAISKELFPVVDRDGIAKPAILLIVEEALAAGVDEVIIVVQQEDLHLFRRFFSDQVSIENFNKLSPTFQAYARRLTEIGARVKLIVQRNQEGFGHAVYCAKEDIGEEPFLLMLGDHLYRSNTAVSCAAQLVEAFELHGVSAVGLRTTPESQINAFGTVTGVWNDGSRILNITEFAEKPTIDYARTNLQVPGLAKDEYLTLFGQYIIKPQLFNYLQEHIENNVRQSGEFQLTTALERLRREDGFIGLLVDGQRYDIGLPHHYVETVAAFAQE